MESEICALETLGEGFSYKMARMNPVDLSVLLGERSLFRAPLFGVFLALLNQTLPITLGTDVMDLEITPAGFIT